jgi:hypothetical protein
LATIVVIRSKRYKIVRHRTERAFEEVYTDFEDTIHANAWNARVPGWNFEDVVAEMGFCLWQAYKRHDPGKGADLGQFFWHIWRDHRNMQIRAFNAQKRAAEELPFTLDELAHLCPVVYPAQLMPPPHIPIDDDVAHAVWSMIGEGYPAVEIQSALHLPRRKYDSLVRSWRTDTVERWLNTSHY